MPRSTYIFIAAIAIFSCKKLPQGAGSSVKSVEDASEKAAGIYALRKDESRGPALCSNGKLHFESGNISQCAANKTFGNPNGKYDCDGFACRLAGNFIFDDAGGDWLKLVYYLKAEDIVKASNGKFKANAGEFCLNEFEIEEGKNKLFVQGCSRYKNFLDPNGVYEQAGKINEDGIVKFRKILKDGSYFELIAEGREFLPYMMTFQIENRFFMKD
jgi:hypothetical protein